MNSLKIGHITQFFHPEKGYQENNLAIIQSSKGNDVTLFCVKNLIKWGVESSTIKILDERYMKLHNVNIIRLNYLFSYSSRFFTLGLSKQLDKVDPDILFIHGVYLPMSLIAMKWGAKNRKKIIVDDHMVQAGSKNKISRIFYSVFRPVFNWYLVHNRIKPIWVAVSLETKNFMTKNYGIKEEISIIPLGFNFNTVFYDRIGALDWLKINSLSISKKYILYIGKIDFNKDPGFIIKVFKSFVSKHIDYELLFVGELDKAYSKSFLNEIEKENLSQVVKILPHVPNDKIRYVFSAVEMTIWPYGSSMAMLEAMACKCPVIASNMLVNNERLSEGRGLLFEGGNALDLLRKMEYVIENRAEITNLAYNWVNQFSWVMIEKKFNEYYADSN